MRSGASGIVGCEDRDQDEGGREPPQLAPGINVIDDDRLREDVSPAVTGQPHHDRREESEGLFDRVCADRVSRGLTRKPGCNLLRLRVAPCNRQPRWERG